MQIGERGAIAFYRARSHESNASKPTQSMEMGHQILAMDAKRDFMQRLLGEMEKKKAIDLSLKSGEAAR